MMVLDIENLKDARVTLTLILINFIIFLLLLLTPTDDILLLLAQRNRLIVENYEVWRLFTPIFLHADPMHFVSNMIALLLFGATVETNNNISKKQYLVIYFVSGLIGNLFSLLLLDLNAISLGASGAIFGLIGVAFIIVATDYQPLLLFSLAYVLFFIVTSFTPGTNYWAHLFGLMGGIIFGYLFYIRKRKKRYDY